MEDARKIDFHFQFLHWMKIKWRKTTRTEEGDVCQQTLESWRERVKELTGGYNQPTFGIWMRLEQCGKRYLRNP